LLGKNGVGKTTLIKILMGFLTPAGGECHVLGDPSHALRPDTRRRVSLLFEGHVAYDFMTIDQIERFYAPFYPRWRRDIYYEFVGRLGLPGNHRIANPNQVRLLFPEDRCRLTENELEVVNADRNERDLELSQEFTVRFDAGEGHVITIRSADIR
jgi:energy-coupling factor transporter ATP-binding protein EcfA2